MAQRKITVGTEKLSIELQIDVPEEMAPVWDLSKSLEVVGTSVPRLDGPDKVTGRAKYTYDINPPGLLYGRILRSAHPAAIVKAVDTSVASKMPGVKAIAFAWDQNKIGTKALRYAGDEILAIAADTPQQAEDAIRAVKVEYAAKPFTVNVDQARDSAAPQVNDGQANIGKSRTRGTAPPVEERLKSAAKTIEATYRTQVQTHSCLETHGLVVHPDGDNLNVWASTQGTFSVRDGLAENLGLKKEQVNVTVHHVGGGFGSKFGPRPEGVLAAKLAQTAKAPVKLMLNRKEEHLAAGNRPNSVQNVRLGADADGKLVACAVKTYGTGGVGGGAGCAIPVIYDIPKEAVYKEEEDVFTNAGPAAAFRAPGHPQGVFAFEQAMDELAHAFGMDPLEFRRKNDGNPVRQDQYSIGAEEIGWTTRRNKEPGAAGGSHLKRGIGMASTQWFNGGGKGAHADIEIHQDGAVVLMQGAQDIGMGFRTAMAIVVAEELGLQPTEITVRIGETRFGYGPGSGGSTTTPSVAPAVHAAAYNARRMLLNAVAEHFKVAPTELDLKKGRIIAKASMELSPATGGADGTETSATQDNTTTQTAVVALPKGGLSWKQACALLPRDKITAGGDRPENFAGFRDGVAGVQFAEVEVDIETGQVRVVKVVAIQDAGRSLNKLGCESQISGGVIQGVSYALFEDRIMDKNTGHMVNPNFMDYKIAGPSDCPLIVPIVYQVANGKNTTGVMGMAEAPTVPTAAAIANAVYNAIGVRIREIPITPDKVLAALAGKGVAHA
ncbi:MAG: xanthine dehydrogenase family protein molybdopterin-binding subunit [Candidatus Sumerlaeaceae bacterium]